MKDVVQTDLGEIIMRPYELKDINPLMVYLYESSPDFLRNIGFNIEKLPGKEKHSMRMSEDIRKNQELPLSERTYSSVVAELDGTAIAQVSLSPLPGSEVAHAHFHILNNGYRGHGLGLPLIKTGLRLLMIHQKRKNAYIEPHRDNERMNKLIKKCGFKFLEDSTYLGPVTLEFPSKRYLIELDKL